MRRRTWIIMAAVPAMLLAADLSWWQLAVSRVRGEFQSWITARKADGWEVATGPLASGGWPYAATITVPNLTLRHRGPDLPGTIRWASASVVLAVPLFHPTEMSIDLEGPQHVQLGASEDMIVTSESIALQID